MTKTLAVPYARRTPLSLPEPGLPVLSHVQNIEYCIKRLRQYPREHGPVIGYVLARSISVVEMNHILLPRSEAEKIRRTDQKFEWLTLDDLLREKQKIEAGEFEIKNGVILGPRRPYVP